MGKEKGDRMSEVKPILAGAICHADDCKKWWNAFFPQGSDDPSGFVQCPYCHRMTGKFMPTLWLPKDGGDPERSDGGIDVA